MWGPSQGFREARVTACQLACAVALAGVSNLVSIYIFYVSSINIQQQRHFHALDRQRVLVDSVKNEACSTTAARDPACPVRRETCDESNDILEVCELSLGLVEF